MSARFTYATLFTGGDGWGVGLRAAGGRGLWGVELDPAIAACATANGAVNVHVADVLGVDWAALPAPDALCISQPCTRISGANTQAGETALDIALARASLRAVEVLQPRWVLVENVPPFAGTVSARLLLDGLWAAGYWVQAGVVNAADYGVPQTRQRWIVRAVRGGWLPMLPASVPWVGWYAAIADLVPTLPESAFAPWQLKRLPADLSGTIVVDCQDSRSAAGLTIRGGADPMFTVSASMWPRRPARAFLVNGANAGRDLTILPDAAPAFTVSAQRDTKSATRAWPAQGRVVRMTIRALQRFQSFPDWYTLPDNAALAAKINGNAVPPRLAQRLIESLVPA